MPEACVIGRVALLIDGVPWADGALSDCEVVSNGAAPLDGEVVSNAGAPPDGGALWDGAAPLDGEEPSGAAVASH